MANLSRSMQSLSLMNVSVLALSEQQSASDSGDHKDDEPARALSAINRLDNYDGKYAAFLERDLACPSTKSTGKVDMTFVGDSDREDDDEDAEDAEEDDEKDDVKDDEEDEQDINVETEQLIDDMKPHLVGHLHAIANRSASRAPLLQKPVNNSSGQHRVSQQGGWPALDLSRPNSMNQPACTPSTSAQSVRMSDRIVHRMSDRIEPARTACASQRVNSTQNQFVPPAPTAPTSISISDSVDSKEHFAGGASSDSDCATTQQTSCEPQSDDQLCQQWLKATEDSAQQPASLSTSESAQGDIKPLLVTAIDMAQVLAEAVNPRLRLGHKTLVGVLQQAMAHLERES